MNQKNLFVFSVALALSAGTFGGAVGCSKHVEHRASSVQTPPQNTPIGQKPGIATDRVTALRSTVTLDKAVILTTEYLYGADLQYSSYHDEGYDLYNQSLAIGHIPAHFRIFGNELQLVTDNLRLFPSDVNHPEQLISRFEITAQTETSITVSTARSGVFLAQLFEATRKPAHGALTIPAADAPRESWVRSFEYAPESDLILQQTSVQLADGSLAEFAESIFPRAAIAPGSQFQAFKMDPDHPTGGDEYKRFMLLKGEKNFSGEDKQTFAQHFDISNGATIDWYVTRNIPDEYVAPVREAVEGWNRYFRAYKGIARDVVLFKGRLPENIRLGDPRYNVINWDSRLVAGAAYESQANDPATGKQSHSLIYMPAAWVKIGLDYWKNGISSDGAGAGRPKGVAGQFRRTCDLDMREAAGLLASGRVASEQEIKEFGYRLLKGTLHHEVGHALGLGHDFKGSLSFDRANPKSLFTDSIMDYNDYEIERGAFPKLDSADGPLLEYDRQALSYIYNKSADIAATDAVLPACNDDIADNLEGGVDPLCTRYDIEKDPSASVVTAFKRVTETKLDGDVSLAEALARVPSLFLTEDKIASVKTEKDFKETIEAYASALKGPLNFYFVTGKASVNKTVRTNLRILLPFADDVLPKEIDEGALRDRVFSGVQQTLALKELPATLAQSLADAEQAGATALARTPYALGLDPSKLQDAVKAATAQVDASFKKFATDEKAGLPQVRALLLAALTYQKKVSYYFGNGRDFETGVIGILADATIAASGRTQSERVAAAKSLVTFKDRPLAEDALKGATDAVTKEAREVKTLKERDTAFAVLAALKELKADDGEE